MEFCFFLKVHIGKLSFNYLHVNGLIFNHQDSRDSLLKSIVYLTRGKLTTVLRVLVLLTFLRFSIMGIGINNARYFNVRFLVADNKIASTLIEQEGFSLLLLTKLIFEAISLKLLGLENFGQKQCEDKLAAFLRLII